MLGGSNITWPPEPIGAATPTKGTVWVMRLLIVLGVLSLCWFLVWLMRPAHMGFPLLFCLLTLAFIFKATRWLYEWYHYFAIAATPNHPTRQDWTVDVYTTACPGEPREMIISTLKAIKAIRYPHQSYLCDEGGDPVLQQVCEELGINYITRSEHNDAKAGNINNALAQTDGEICVILDPDHEPAPYFLDRILGYFDDPRVGFVQIVQAYYNQSESLVALGAAEQTYHFYGPIMMGMHGHGTAQAIGANCTFRRKALESIGGHAAGLAEDMHTAMRLHAEGWKSVYAPEILTRGLVPSTLSAYYKQQLKWARGCFELLFEKYPPLFKGFSIRQKFHYLSSPLYYLYGIVGLIDIAIPILALLLGHIAWHITLTGFLQHYLPVVVIATIIRQAAQRYLLEPHERGFHVTGGLLRAGTWWIYLLGFLSAIFRTKIPYIPTPKEEQLRNAWLLSLPNLIMASICMAAVPYGLSRDWTPYSLCMAGFALWQASILGSCVILGQQLVLQDIHKRLSSMLRLPSWRQFIRQRLVRIYQATLSILRERTAVVAVLLLGFLPVYSVTQQDWLVNGSASASPKEKNIGGFYVGIYEPELDEKNIHNRLDKIEGKLGADFRIVSIYQNWGPQSLEDFPEPLLNEIWHRDAIPLITWEPWTHTFPEYRNHPDLGKNRKVFAAILRGAFDAYIETYAAKLRDLGEPVLLRFAHEPDNPRYPWSYSGGNTLEEYLQAWDYVVASFDRIGASNVGWVWNPWEEDAIEDYFPGYDVVDWIGVTALNYGYAAENGRWYELGPLYEPFRSKLVEYKKPVMLTEFGSVEYGGDRSAWLDNALTSIRDKYPEIRSIVFFHSNQDKNWPTSWRPDGNEPAIDWTFVNSPNAAKFVRTALQQPPFNETPPPADIASTGVLWSDLPKTPYHSPHVKGRPGEFQLLVEGQPLYIRGVAYSNSYHWDPDDLILTRRQLESDFGKIRAMGANVIRRYGTGWYDRNVLNVAQEYDLKVLFGLWFEPNIDYRSDMQQLRDYEAEVEKAVRTYRDHPALMGWSLGNEVWGILKHYYGQPYLTQVRNAYARFVERLAQRVHQLDPDHPVFTMFEHTQDLPGALADFSHAAPSIDVIGINSYYAQHISKLHRLTREHDPNRPYLVSEFGSEGYWHKEYTARDWLGGLREPSGAEKSRMYEFRWREYIEGKRGRNIGGFAFTWRDRNEGSSTWFGITDFKGRLKPTYYALQHVWTGKESTSQPPNIKFIIGPYEPVEPKAQVELSATVDHSGGARLNYEWSLMRREQVSEALMLDTERAGDLRSLEDGKRAIATAPDEPGWYRIYLHVSDQHGNVDSASWPLLVQIKR